MDDGDDLGLGNSKPKPKSAAPLPEEPKAAPLKEAEKKVDRPGELIFFFQDPVELMLWQK